LCVAKAAISLCADTEVFGTESAIIGTGYRTQGMIKAEGVTEFPRLMGHILLDNDVLGKIPSPPVAAK